MVVVASGSVVLAATNPSLSTSPAPTVLLQKAVTGGFVLVLQHPVRRAWLLGRWPCPSVRASGGG
jgi:hypothetical protein